MLLLLPPQLFLLPSLLQLLLLLLLLQLSLSLLPLETCVPEGRGPRRGAHTAASNRAGRADRGGGRGSPGLRMAPGSGGSHEIEPPHSVG